MRQTNKKPEITVWWLQEERAVRGKNEKEVKYMMNKRQLLVVNMLYTIDTL